MTISKELIEARRVIKSVIEERKKAALLPPPRTLEEELRRQDAIAKRAALEQKYGPILEAYRAKRREEWRRKEERRKARRNANI